MNDLPANLETLVAFYNSHHKKETPRLRSVTEDYLKSAISKGNRQRHIDTLKLHHKHLLKFLGNPRIGNVTTKNLDDFLARIKNLKSRLNYRVTVVSLFKFAVAKGSLPKMATAADGTDRPKPVKPEPEVFSPADMHALLIGSTGKLRAYLAIGAFSGCRSSEIQRLQWKHIKGDSIHLGPGITKTQRRRMAEISANLSQWLEPLRGEPEDFVTFRSPAALYAATAALCKHTGVTWKPNALRHSFVSYHLELHQNPPRTSKAAGHSLRILETEYLQLVPREKAAAWFDITPTPAAI
jgi:integrase